MWTKTLDIYRIYIHIHRELSKIMPSNRILCEMHVRMGSPPIRWNLVNSRENLILHLKKRKQSLRTIAYSESARMNVRNKRCQNKRRKPNANHTTFTYLFRIHKSFIKDSTYTNLMNKKGNAHMAKTLKYSARFCTYAKLQMHVVCTHYEANRRHSLALGSFKLNGWEIKWHCLVICTQLSKAK